MRAKFDYCIVDEASQITLPACVGPLRYANAFILVGDHYQLPPVVRNPVARDLSTSLFKMLSESHPQAVVALEEQYRMNKDITDVANMLTYNGRLKCGTDKVAKTRLVLAKPEGLRLAHVHDDCTQCWMAALLDPERSFIFCDTDLVPALETKPGDLVQNDVEADLVMQMTGVLLACGMEAGEIGIISPYRAQLRAIGNLLRQFGPLADVLEINTVDKYQGRDKDCILVSLVRSNAKQNVCSTVGILTLLGWRFAQGLEETECCRDSRSQKGHHLWQQINVAGFSLVSRAFRYGFSAKLDVHFAGGCSSTPPNGQGDSRSLSRRHGCTKTSSGSCL